MSILPQISKNLYESIKNTFGVWSSNTVTSIWKPNTQYYKGEKVKYFNVIFECKEDHLSSNDFCNDSKYWKYPSKMVLMK